MKHAISWFEIPTVDIDRAHKFYEKVFECELMNMDMPGIKMRAFPLDNPMEGIGGTLVHSDFHKPHGSDGPLLYMNGNPDVQVFLDRAAANGGTVIVPKTNISEQYGDFGVILDTEGNRIAFHNIPAGMSGGA